MTGNVLASSVSVLLNNGDGSFQAKRDYATGVSPESVAIGDLNGDRKADLVTANEGPPAGTVSVLTNDGNGNFAARRDYPSGGVPRTVAIGEVNRDGKPDVVFTNLDTNGVSVLSNSGRGRFEDGGDFATGSDPWGLAPAT